MTDTEGVDHRRSGLPRDVLILVGMAAATVTVAGARAASDILGPVVLAAVLAIAGQPICSGLMRWGWPRWAGTVVALLSVYVGLLLLGVTLGVSTVRFAGLLPTYEDQFHALVSNVENGLAGLGVSSAQVDKITSSFDFSRLTQLMTELLSGVLGLFTNLFFILAVILFMFFDAGAFGRHLERLRGGRSGFVTALESFAVGTRRYLLVSTAFGFVVAVIDTGVLLALGVPGAVLWGVLAFITNYIPNIGFLIGLVPPAVLALLEGGPSLMLTVIAAYTVINVLIQSVLQPKLVGDAVGISASISFLSLVVWAWILGPVGAILAVPLTLLVKAIFIDVDPSARWVAGLIGVPAADDD